ncbi:hypothetical protein BD770DRAFT_416241 [Pilaira anomala]|nr:hypothetical protein BD770DRAFT_416241 [Pilaira anomala]
MSEFSSEGATCFFLLVFQVEFIAFAATIPAAQKNPPYIKGCFLRKGFEEKCEEWRGLNEATHPDDVMYGWNQSNKIGENYNAFKTMTYIFTTILKTTALIAPRPGVFIHLFPQPNTDAAPRLSLRTDLFTLWTALLWSQLIEPGGLEIIPF